LVLGFVATFFDHFLHLEPRKLTMVKDVKRSQLYFLFLQYYVSGSSRICIFVPDPSCQHESLLQIYALKWSSLLMAWYIVLDTYILQKLYNALFKAGKSDPDRHPQYLLKYTILNKPNFFYFFRNMKSMHFGF